MFGLWRSVPVHRCLPLRGNVFARLTSSIPPDLKKRTFYEILGVSRKAKKAEIKSAYLALAKKYHPDLNADNPDEAETKFKEVQEAHATLSDSWKRALYDQDLQFGEHVQTQEVDQDAWTEHWDKETPEEREVRRDRYRRYAAGERNDLPPPPLPVRMLPVILLSVPGVIFFVCVQAPDWIDRQSDPTFCDKMHDDKSVPLVRAFHDPVLDRWERLPENGEAPRPSELYKHYVQTSPEMFSKVDPKRLPRVSLTVLHMPRTETVKATFQFQPDTT